MGYELIASTIPAVTGGLFSYVRISTTSDSLVNSPADILAKYIIQQAIGDMTEPTDGDDWPLYTTYMPDGSSIKNNAGCLYDTTPIKDGRIMDGSVIDHYGIQLMIRSTTYAAGYTKAESIARATESILKDTLTIGAYEYELKNISRQGSVIPLGAEKGTKGRSLFTVNFLATIKRIVS